MNDPLDSIDYNPRAHVNALFPDLDSLALLPRIQSKLQRHEIELQRSIRKQASQADAPAADIHRVEADLTRLFDEVAETQRKAIEIEERVSAMTQSIRKLDRTKKNVTATITLLKRLQMLVSAFSQLQRLCAGRKYAETASLLSAVIQLMTHFRGYRSIPQIAALSQEVADLQRTCLEKVSSDFETFFSEGLVPSSRKILAEACTLVDVLGDGPRERIIAWYTNSQLREYRNIFRSNEEAASLDNISRRYAWLKRIYKACDSSIFPEHWHVYDALVKSSCETTKEDLAVVLKRSPPDVKTLLQALQDTMDFDPNLAVVFEPYLGIFVEMQDKTLAGMLATYRATPWPGLEEQVLPSSADLFYFYLTTITQCAQLSNGQPLWEFARVMAKYLNQYTEMLASKYSNGVVTVEEIIMVLKTADYCSTTTQQLEERMKSVIAPALADRVTYEYQNNQFLQLMNRSLSLLVSHLEKVIDLGLREMKTNSADVTGESQYVSLVVAGLLREGKRVIQNLGKERFIRNFCDRVVESFVTQYVTAIGRCRPVTESGAEQMLLDIHAIKSSLANLEHMQVKTITKQFAKIETILKLLLTVNHALVQNYMLLIQDKSTTNFMKILDIKGIPRQQQSALLDQFVKSIHDGLDDRNELLSNLRLEEPTFVGKLFKR